MLSQRYYFKYTFDYNLLIFHIAFPVSIFLVAYFFVSIPKSRDYRYKFKKEKIVVCKGKKQGIFKWSDFICFCISFYEVKNEENERNDFYGKIRKVKGETYYLKLKPRGFFSKINLVERLLVVHAKPENYKKVYAFLLTKLSQEKAKNTGFLFYYFK